MLVYRYDFPSIDTYTVFVGTNSLTNIVNNTFAFRQVVDVISFPTDFTGDVVLAGDLTAENLIVGLTNVITELTSLDTRLDTEEPKTSALQILTATHTTDIASNNTDITALQGRLDIEESKTTSLQSLTAGHTTNIATNTANILTKQNTITDGSLSID